MQTVKCAPVLLVALALAWVGPPAAAEDLPRLAVEAKVFEFGEVIQGDVVEHRFGFKNVGDAPLVVRKVKATCGCTATELEQRQYAAGESGEVEVRVDTQGRMGFQNLEVWLYTNDASQQDRGPNVTILKIKGQVTSLVQVMPPAVYFQNVLQGSEDTKKVTILPGDRIAETALDAEAIMPSRGFLVTESRHFVQGKRVGLELTVKLTGQAPAGKLEEYVEVHLGLDRQPVVRVPILAMINPEIVAFPNRIPFYEVKRSEGASRMLVLERLRGEGVPILAVEVDEDYFTYAVDEVVPNSRTEIELSLKPGAPAGLFQREVRVFLDHPQVPMVAVPVFGEVLSDVQLDPAAIVFRRKAVEPGQSVGVAWLSARSTEKLTGESIQELSLSGMSGLEPVVVEHEDGRVGIELVAGAEELAGRYRGHIRCLVAPFGEWLTIEVFGQIGETPDGG